MNCIDTRTSLVLGFLAIGWETRRSLFTRLKVNLRPALTTRASRLGYTDAIRRLRRQRKRSAFTDG